MDDEVERLRRIADFAVKQGDQWHGVTQGEGATNSVLAAAAALNTALYAIASAGFEIAAALRANKEKPE